MFILDQQSDLGVNPVVNEHRSIISSKQKQEQSS